jgi:hypothetical protein
MRMLLKPPMPALYLCPQDASQKLHAANLQLVSGLRPPLTSELGNLKEGQGYVHRYEGHTDSMVQSVLV